MFCVVYRRFPGAENLLTLSLADSLGLAPSTTFGRAFPTLPLKGNFRLEPVGTRFKWLSPTARTNVLLLEASQPACQAHFRSVTTADGP